MSENSISGLLWICNSTSSCKELLLELIIVVLMVWSSYDPNLWGVLPEDPGDEVDVVDRAVVEDPPTDLQVVQGGQWWVARSGLKTLGCANIRDRKFHKTKIMHNLLVSLIFFLQKSSSGWHCVCHHFSILIMPRSDPLKNSENFPPSFF